MLSVKGLDLGRRRGGSATWLERGGVCRAKMTFAPWEPEGDGISHAKMAAATWWQGRSQLNNGRALSCLERLFRGREAFMEVATGCGGGGIHSSGSFLQQMGERR